MNKWPNKEGFYWYKKAGCEATVVQTEFRPDSGELYAFCIGFEGGTPVRLMDGLWSDRRTLQSMRQFVGPGGGGGGHFVDRPPPRLLNLQWTKNIRDGMSHFEWAAPCGCAYHPGPQPHIHPCKEHETQPVKEQP